MSIQVQGNGQFVSTLTAHGHIDEHQLLVYRLRRTMASGRSTAPPLLPPYGSPTPDHQQGCARPDVPARRATQPRIIDGWGAVP